MSAQFRTSQWWFYLLFAVSGFAGLIYESIWTGYLKLMLGHAAYAQTAVLALFMGGMAAGAWVVSRFGSRWRSLVAYAIVEGLIGVIAIIFQPVFIYVQGLLFESWLPQMEPAMAVVLKWCVACLLILPQSVLLGSTFPLMSSAVIRRFPATPGRTLAMLYFTNSLGAAIGVLCAGFYLVPRVGLPGGMLTAGLLNVAVAMSAWAIGKSEGEETSVSLTLAIDSVSVTAGNVHRLTGMLLGLAFGTGMASFFYEIGWIRMLSMVLGASTHSFELMLSAFILGLALGGYWIRKRIDGMNRPVVVLGWIQVSMGILAITTLFLYGASFDVMSFVFKVLSHTENGYVVFTVFGHGIAMAIMLPATFCAGMTLPLTTAILYRAGYGEPAIGRVYAANTLGSIVGVLAAVHFFMPQFGLHGVLISGGTLDILLGVALLATGAGVARWLAALFVGGGVVASAMAFGSPNPARMASGVFRSGEAILPSSAKVIMQRDGKTASVALVQIGSNLILQTNGKPDGSINLSGDFPASDEETQLLVGVAPLIFVPEAREVAMIGLGTGMSSATLLASPNIVRLDTIEIEPAMVDAARTGFYSHVSQVFDDRRSHIHIDDAKSYFSTRNTKYDLILSEPSNPWVSGVSSLFTREFYRTTKRHLKPGGLLVQWLQGYESNAQIIASILNALSSEYSDYAVFQAGTADLIIVAAPDGKLPSMRGTLLGWPTMAKELRRLGIRSESELVWRCLGNRALLRSLFENPAVPANSDYFPFVDLHAASARFVNPGIPELGALTTPSMPIGEMLSGASSPPPWSDGLPAAIAAKIPRSSQRLAAWQIHDEVLAIRRGEPLRLPLLALVSLLNTPDACIALGDQRIDVLMDISDVAVSQIPSVDAVHMIRRLGQGACWRSDPYQRWLSLVKAVAGRDAPAMAAHADQLLSALPPPESDRLRFLVKAAMLGRIAQGDTVGARDIWRKFGPGLDASDSASGAEILWLRNLAFAEELARQLHAGARQVTSRDEPMSSPSNRSTR